MNYDYDYGWFVIKHLHNFEYLTISCWFTVPLRHVNALLQLSYKDNCWSGKILLASRKHLTRVTGLKDKVFRQKGLAWRSSTKTFSSWLIYNPSIHLLEANIPANITYSQCPTSNSDNFITSAILPLSYCYLVKALGWTATNTLHRSCHYASLSEYTNLSRLGQGNPPCWELSRCLRKTKYLDRQV